MYTPNEDKNILKKRISCCLMLDGRFMKDVFGELFGDCPL